jgi:hypothetical protein
MDSEINSELEKARRPNSYIKDDEGKRRTKEEEIGICDYSTA